MHKNEAATHEEIGAAISALNNAVSSLVRLKPAAEKIEAVSAEIASAGVKYESTKNATGAVEGTVSNLGGLTPGSYVGYRCVDFDIPKGSFSTIILTYAEKNNDADVENSKVTVHLDNLNSEPIAEFVHIEGTGNEWNTFRELTADLKQKGITGVHDVYLKFHGATKPVMNLHSLIFGVDDTQAVIAADLKHLSGDKTMVGIGDKLEYTLTAEEGFELPDTIVIVMDGKTLGEGEYTYSKETGTIVIEQVTGNICISAEASSSHEHSWSNEWSKNETHHWHACSGCDEKNDVAPHTPGAAATEIDPQICTVCGYIIAHATGHIHHTTTLVPAVEATCVAKGHRAYYTCSGCSKLFADENATEELTEADVTPKTDPTNHVGGTEVLNAKDATYTEEGYTGDTCCKSCHAVISYGHVIPKLTKPSKPSGGTVRPVSPNAGVGKKPEAEKDALPFTDVPQTAWYYESVQSAWAADLIDGVTATKFKPDDTLTVAQAIKLAAALYQMEHEGEVTLRNGSETWYDSYVSYAVANGIIEKDYASYTAAHMNAAITRAEFVHIFHGAESTYKAINQVADGAIPDVKSGDAFASDIYEFYRAGILTGSDAKGTFHPASSIKRSEVATILLRMFEAAARVSIDLP